MIDNMIRHAASKMSSFHFVSTDEHARRLVAIGEDASRVFVVGTPAIDRIRSEPIIDRNAVLKKCGAPIWARYAIVIFHPVLGEESSGGEYFLNILNALQKMELPAFVSYPNIDSGHHQIATAIERMKADNAFVFYHNLPNSDFVNLMRNASILVGNSSCGIVEAPYFKLGTVNVGRRQIGRASVGNVVFSGTSQESIEEAINRVLSDPFQTQLCDIGSPYGDGYATDRAFDVLRSLDWKKFLRKTTDMLPGKA
jgi:UDP-hydrolysing UDP-N-acetyl-D-glucosamine 2-epimerase